MHRAFVISDLHLGGADGFQMCPPRNQAALASLISTFAKHSPARRVHLVVAGDIVDFLAEAPFSSFTDSADAARDKLEAIMDRTAEVWHALALALAAGIDITFMIGNHDIELVLPSTQRLLHDRLGVGAKGAGRFALRGDGKPLRLGSTIVTHGNHGDLWNFVFYDQLTEYASGGERDHAPLIVPGSELVTKVMNPIKRRHPWVDLLKPETSALLPLLAVLDPVSIRTLPTVIRLYHKARQRARGADFENIGDDPHMARHLHLARTLAGVAEEISVVDQLAAPFASMWHAAKAQARRAMRCALATLAESTHFRTDVELADVQASAQALLREHSAETVVFGHTHLAKRVALDGGKYLNTGTFSDLLALPSETWLEVDAEAEQQPQAVFDAFLNDLRNNNVARHRRLFPTYVQVDYNDTDSTAELYLADKPLPNGDIMRLPL